MLGTVEVDERKFRRGVLGKLECYIMQFGLAVLKSTP